MTNDSFKQVQERIGKLNQLTDSGVAFDEAVGAVYGARDRRPPVNDTIPIQALIDAAMAVEVPAERLAEEWPDAIRAVPQKDARFLVIGGRLLSISNRGCEVLAPDPERPYWCAVGPHVPAPDPIDMLIAEVFAEVG